MARTTKQLSGPGKDKFLRGIVVREAGLSSEAAGKVGNALAEAVTEVRVRREVWEEMAKLSPPEPRRRPGERRREPAAEPAAVAAVANTAGKTAASAFDPYMFSAVAVLTKTGKAGLAAELARIANAADLQALARAQHLAVDPELADAPALREAIVAAVERRIAERKAAAS